MVLSEPMPNTSTKPVLSNIEAGEKRRLINAVHDLFLVTESYSPKVFQQSEEDPENVLIDIKTLIMIIEDSAALISELRPRRPIYNDDSQLQMKFDNSDY
jgi:hypothetical protein